MIQKPTRKDNIIDLVLTNKHQDIVETNIKETQLSDHRLVELLLGHNPLRPKQDNTPSYDKNSFRAVDFHRADFDAMNEQLSSVDWYALQELCGEDENGSNFLELLRLTILQITLLHSPAKAMTDPDSTSGNKSRHQRDRYVLKRRRRKLNARISALNEKDPSSPTIAKLKNEVSLLTFEISELIIKQLNEKEAKAVSTIKTNPRYFFSYAKRFAKMRSSVAPIRDGNGTLKTDPTEKAELL